MLYWTALSPAETTLFLPFVKSFAAPLNAVVFISITYFMIVGMSNAVNLTDGLDGLAIMPSVMVGGALGVFAYASGNADFVRYLAIPAVPGAGEVLIFCAAMVGAGLGFLWFNTYPAQVFMGDTGSLPLGALIGLAAIVTRQEVLLVLVGGVFVIETLSVLAQVGWFRFTKTRLLKCSPLHNHFLFGGQHEMKIVVRFWIAAALLAIAAITSLRLRG